MTLGRKLAGRVPTSTKNTRSTNNGNRRESNASTVSAASATEAPSRRSSSFSNKNNNNNNNNNTAEAFRPPSASENFSKSMWSETSLVNRRKRGVGTSSSLSSRIASGLAPTKPVIPRYIPPELLDESGNVVNKNYNENVGMDPTIALFEELDDTLPGGMPDHEKRKALLAAIEAHNGVDWTASTVRKAKLMTHQRYGSILSRKTRRRRRR